MAGAAFLPLDTGDVQVSAQLDGAVLRLVMSGSVDTRDPGPVFDPYWQATDAALRREGVRHVELDISGLEFMNSSGILTLVRWVTRVKTPPPYQIVIRYDREVTWQQTSLPVLAKLVPGVVRVEAR
jgi:hypothetical protein